jgi:DNA repair protein RadA/Sms
LDSGESLAAAGSEGFSPRGEVRGGAAFNSQLSSPVSYYEAEKGQDYLRMSTGQKEFDRVLGGGLVKGALVLVGGDPGIGKSTLLLQAAFSLAKKHKVLYASGEESVSQIKLRGDRLTAQGAFKSEARDRFELLSETSYESIENWVQKENPQILIIDSIQTVFTEALDSAPGSVSQVREVSGLLMNLAKSRGLTILLVGHVTKEGSLAGPRVLEHMVDTVLYFEGDAHQSFRILRGIKNRFGSTNELGIFEMKSEGLMEVANPSEIFLTDRENGVTGTVTTCTLEGTRPLLLEIQALLSSTSFPYPKRTTVGVDTNKIALFAAVIEKKLDVQVLDQDVFVNVVGGMKIQEPSCDLAIVAAMLSSFQEQAVSPKTAVLGEVGLTGEVRPVSRLEERLRELERLGFEKAIIPSAHTKKLNLKKYKLEILPLAHLRELGDLAFEEKVRGLW